MSDLYRIDEKLIENDVKIHLYAFVLTNFNNNPKNYDYTESVIIPETEKIKKAYTIENIKKQPIIAEYRSFYWSRLRIDPTKVRPSGEALVRRLLHGKKLPNINYFVDGYNWASAVSLIPISASDKDEYNGVIEMRYAKKDEEFLPIGDKIRKMTGKEIITVDEDGQILSQFPHRDADKTKVTKKTENITITCLGIENISKADIRNSAEKIIEYLKKCKVSELNNFQVSKMEYIKNF